MLILGAWVIMMRNFFTVCLSTERQSVYERLDVSLGYSLHEVYLVWTETSQRAYDEHLAFQCPIAIRSHTVGQCSVNPKGFLTDVEFTDEATTFFKPGFKKRLQEKFNHWRFECGVIFEEQTVDVANGILSRGGKEHNLVLEFMSVLLTDKRELKHAEGLGYIIAYKPTGEAVTFYDRFKLTKGDLEGKASYNHFFAWDVTAAYIIKNGMKDLLEVVEWCLNDKQNE